jgi:hypothetical protein
MEDVVGKGRERDAASQKTHSGLKGSIGEMTNGKADSQGSLVICVDAIDGPTRQSEERAIKIGSSTSIGVKKTRACQQQRCAQRRRKHGWKNYITIVSVYETFLNR